MREYSLKKAKESFEEIINLVYRKEEDYIILTKYGKPIAKIVPYLHKKQRKAGCLKDKYDFKDTNWFNNEITDLFLKEN